MSNLNDNLTPDFFKKISSHDMNLLFASFSFSYKILSLFLIFSVFISIYNEITMQAIQNGGVLFFIISLAFLWISFKYGKEQLSKFKELDFESKQNHLFSATIGLFLIFFATIAINGILYIL